ncbi:unnamed protein product [Acanthosepion pharaonis]|uniref:Uncharacterized protein n=1 Tax=Acanthosepion pharaonis TaxID=158019 RepID=A0A812D8K7_ACAPH|nr:unnamed protein product [Sepia pharaonis]
MKNKIVPISSKLSQLIELSERLSSDDSLPTLLPDSTNASVFVHDVREAGESLIQVAKEWINKCENTRASAQMKQASENLQETVDKVCQLSVNLNSDKHSETYKELVLVSNHLLQYTFQIFLIAKESELKNLSDIVTRVKNKASMLKWNITSAESMTKYFKELTEELLLLNKLCMRRHKELIGEQQQKDMIVNGLHMIRIIFPSLQEILKTCLARPNDEHAKSRRDFVIHRIITAASLLNDVIMNRLPTDPMVVNEPGFFVNLLSKIINTLSETNRVLLCENFESWLHSAIQHAMCVAHFIPKERRELVVNVCLKVLEAQRYVYSLYQKLSSEIKEEQLRNTYNSWCNKLINCLCHLEVRINKEVLHLLVSVFAETSEPLERLVDPVLFPGASECDVKKLMSLKDFFHNHLDSVWNVARFVAASSHKLKRVREIEIAIHNFECLDPEISSLISLKIQELSNQPICMSDAAIIQLKMLVKEWKSQMTNLVTLLDLTVDPHLFLAVSAKRLKEELMPCHDLARAYDFQKLLCLSRSIRAKTMRIAQFLANIKNSENTFSDWLYQTQIIEKIEQALQVHKTHHKSLKEAANFKGLSKFNVTSFLESTSFLIETSEQATNLLCSNNSTQDESLLNSGYCPFLTPQSRQPLLLPICSPGCNPLKTQINCPTNITKQISLTTPTVHWTELTTLLTHPPNEPWNVMSCLEYIPSTNSNCHISSSQSPHNTLV